MQSDSVLAISNQVVFDCLIDKVGDLEHFQLLGRHTLNEKEVFTADLLLDLFLGD